MTIVTPSAKAHERVTGRWLRDIEATNTREWAVYYLKAIFGTPIPWLMWSFACLTFLSRAGLEIAAWSCALLTMLYIFSDRASASREFSFFRVGGDLFLIGYVIVGIVSACTADSFLEGFATLGGVRWVLLLYAMTYCWELFPGLDRVFGLITTGALIACGYAIWQHFTGVDLIRGAELKAAPVSGAVFFTPVSFFNTPEILGTLLAMILPFPAAAYLLADRRDARWARYSALAIALVLCLGVLWTYRPGMWLAGLAGIIVAILMQARHSIGLILAVGAFVAGMFWLSYGSPDRMLETVQNNEVLRSERQRQQINTQVDLWQKSPWIGVGTKALTAADYDPGTGNVYFQVLAQSGFLGAGFYLLFVLGFLLSTYQIFKEIPSTHYWHRVLIAGGLASQLAFHVAGLYWSTLSEALAFNLYVLIVSSISYVIEHYGRGLVPDDHSL